MTIIQLLIIVPLVYLLGFLPGRLILEFLPFPKEVKFAASFALTFILYYLIGFLSYFLNFNPSIIHLTFLFLVLLWGGIISKRRHLTLVQEKDLHKTFFFTYVVIVALQGLLPIYSGGLWYFDWFEHFQRMLFFLKDLPLNFSFGPYLLTGRPPFFNIVTYFYQSILGDEFWIYQVVATLLNTVVLLPCFLLCRDILGLGKHKNLFIFICALFLLNPAFIKHATFTWTKSLSAFYVLMGIYFYWRARVENQTSSFLISAGLLSASYLTHYSAGIYILPLFAHFSLVSLLNLKRQLLRLILFFSIFLFLLLPWFGWATIKYGSYQTFLGNTAYEWQKDITVAARIKKDSTNLIYTFLPLIPKNYITLVNSQTNTFVKLHDLAIYFYLSTIPGNLTIGISLFLLIYLFKGGLKQQITFIAYLLITSIIGLVVYPTLAKGMANITLLPLAFMLFCLAIKSLFYFKFIKKLPTAFFVVITILMIFDGILGIGLRVYTLGFELIPGKNSGFTLPIHADNYKLKTENHLVFLYDKFFMFEPFFWTLAVLGWLWAIKIIAYTLITREKIAN